MNNFQSDGTRHQNLPLSANLTVFFYHVFAATLARMNVPQQLSRQAIDEFKAIYQEEFDQELSDDEVQEIAMRLLRFFGMLVKPDNTGK